MLKSDLNDATPLLAADVLTAEPLAEEADVNASANADASAPNNIAPKRGSAARRLFATVGKKLSKNWQEFQFDCFTYIWCSGPNRALFEAASTNRIKFFKLLLEVPSIKVNARYGDYGDTALMSAIRGGHTEIAKLLIEHPMIDVNIQNPYGWTALLLAIDRGHSEIAEMLLKNTEIDLHKTTRFVEQTALMLAVEKNLPKIVYSLVVVGADISVYEHNPHKSLLIWAADGGHIDLVKKLLARNDIDVTMKNESGFMALEVAIINGHTEIAKALIANAKFDVHNAKKYCNALQWAISKDNVEIVKELLQRKDFPVNVVADPHTALTWVARNGDKFLWALTELLKRTDIDINVPAYGKSPENSMTPLMMAAQYGHIEILKVLLSCKDIKVNKPNNVGVTALMLAATNGHLEIVKELIKHKADVTLPQKAGGGALTFAAHNGHTETVKELLKYSDVDNGMALWYAATNGHYETVNALLSVPNVDTTVTNKGATAFISAVQKFHIEVVKMFLHNPNILAKISKADLATAKEIASIRGHKQLQDLLEKATCEPTVQTEKSITEPTVQILKPATLLFSNTPAGTNTDVRVAASLPVVTSTGPVATAVGVPIAQVIEVESDSKEAKKVALTAS